MAFVPGGSWPSTARFLILLLALVAAFGSLFMVAGKRYSEISELGAEAGTRASLARYTATYLRFVWTLACTAVILSYSLWAFEQRGDREWLGLPWAAFSIAPFTLVNLFAGASHIRFRDYLLGTAISMTPGTLAMASLAGTALDVYLNPEHLHLFDAASGAALH